MNKEVPTAATVKPPGAIAHLERRSAAILAVLSAVLILGCAPKGQSAIGQAVAASQGGSHDPSRGPAISSYPWPGGTLTWSGQLSGARTFKTVFCQVVNGSLVDFHAPGSPMRQRPMASNFFAAKFGPAPGNISFDGNWGPGDGNGVGELETRIGRYHDPVEALSGVLSVKSGARYGVEFHHVKIGLYDSRENGGGHGREITLSGTLWCNRVVTMSL